MKYIVLVLCIAVLLTACATTDETGSTGEERALTGMPCHTMPDGTLMGDCDGYEPGEAHDIHDMHHQQHLHVVTSEEEFIREMIPHHQEAIDTSRIILASTQNDALWRLAAEIISAQEEEIQVMTGWLNEWYDGLEETNYQEMMPNLELLEGVERDNAYLHGMIIHHEMAVLMAESLFELPDVREEVRAFAEEIIRVQEAEIALMQQLLLQ